MQSITLPKFAQGVTAATVVRWFKRPGDSFAAGDALLELEVEDALVHLEASRSGSLVRIIAKPPATVDVGGQLAEVEMQAAEELRPEATRPKLETLPKGEETVVQQALGAAASSRGGDPGNVTPILMPQAGNTMEEGIVLSWKVAEGERIQVGQVICEIETDKATIEYESPEAGRLARIVAHENDTVPIKEPIAFLADNDSDVDAYLAAKGTPVPASAAAAAASPGGAAAAPSEPAVARSTAPRTAGGRIKASPAARRIALERGLDLTSVGRGSGPGGRILSTDLERATVAAVASADGKAVRRPMSKMRRAIGLNLQRSKQTIPHFYARMTIDAGALFAYYRQQKPQTNCTVNDCVVLALGRAMAEFPAVRSQIDGDEIVEYPHANIGIAIGVDEGLVVPVVCNVDTLSLAQLAGETKRVVENGRCGKLENIGQGNFTITNLGMFGVEEFSAIINPPESGILAVSALRETAIVANGTLRLGRVMTLTLSADHRIVDGLLAAKFLARLKEILENPNEELA